MVQLVPAQVEEVNEESSLNFLFSEKWGRQREAAAPAGRLVVVPPLSAAHNGPGMGNTPVVF